MFVPPHFAETDPVKLHDAIERHSFGMLVTVAGGEPFVTSLPFLLTRRDGPHGTLWGHMARANPQWRELTTQTVLAVFNGPHAYISPTWYEADHTVPTWNYVAVHAYGRASLIEDSDELLNLLQRTVRTYEEGMAQPWELDTTSSAIRKMLPQIVGFRVEITRIEGKWKVNQNHTVERRSRVANALQQQGGANSTAIAELIQATLPSGE